MSKRTSFFNTPAPLLKAPHRLRVNAAWSFFSAILITSILYTILIFAPDSLKRYADVFLARGPTPPITVLFFVWAWVSLVLKRSIIRGQRKALRYDLVPPENDFRISVDNVPEILERIDQQVDFPDNFLLIRRLRNSLFNLKNLGQVSEVNNMLEIQADNDDTKMETSYSLIKGLVWALPVLGFIGTVLGLSAAVGGFGDVLKSTDDIAEVTESLTAVTAGLGTAFETTLLALVLAVIVQLRMTFVKKAEEELLDECRTYCLENISKRLRLEATVAGDAISG